MQGINSTHLKNSHLKNHIRTMQIQAITMRWGTGDNYAYLVTDDATKESLIIDPAEPHEYVILEGTQSFIN